MQASTSSGFFFETFGLSMRERAGEFGCFISNGIVPAGCAGCAGYLHL